VVSRAGDVCSERHAGNSPKSGIAGLAGAPYRVRLHRVGAEPIAFQTTANLTRARLNFPMRATADESCAAAPKRWLVPAAPDPGR